VQGQALEDDPVPVHADALGHDPEHGDAAAVVHAVEHVVEGARVAAHLQADVEAFHVQVAHHVLERGVADVDHAGGAHVGRQLEAVVVDVGHHHVARADVLADARGDDADRAGTGDQHVLADHVELQRAVRGVAVRVEERGKFRRDLVGDRPQVGGRHDDVFGEGAVAIDADADGVRAQVLAAAAAVAAVAAHDVAFGRHALPDLVAGHARTDLGDAADELVADHQAGLDRALAPLVPQVDVQVGAADGRLLDLDQDLVRPGHGHRHVLHPDALAGLALDQRLHRRGHPSFQPWEGPRLYARGYTRTDFPTRSDPMRLTLKTLAFALAACAGPALAGEGMSVPQQLPEIAAPLQKHGLEWPPEQLADLSGQPMGAVVSVGGCTASFVSPQGLVVTSDHCAYGSLQLNSTPENNLIETGFNAAALGDELSGGPNARIYVLDSIQDVTAQARAAIASAKDAPGRTAALEALSKQLVSECEAEPGFQIGRA